MRIVLLVTVMAMGFAACNNKDGVPNGILPKEQMQSVLWDIMQAESFTGSFVRKEPNKNLPLEDAKYQQQIFSMHHISKEDFYKSYSYYKEHTDLLVAVLDSMTAQENRKETDRLAVKAKEQAKVDSIKAKAFADSVKINGLKNKPLLKIDSTALKAKQRVQAKLKKHKVIPAVKSK